MDFWGALVTAFIGSAAGAAVGAGIGWRALVQSDQRAHQDREQDRTLRREERLDIALGGVISEITDLAEKQGSYRDAVAASRPLPDASSARLFATIQACTLSADHRQRKVLDEVSKLVAIFLALPDSGDVIELATDLVFVITEWRTGELSQDAVDARLDELMDFDLRVPSKSAHARRRGEAPDGSGS
jgi:hypothetical protein